MAKTLVALPQITPPATLAAGAPLYTNIERMAALSPKDKLAMAVYFRTIELANDASSPLTTYDASQTGATLVSNIIKLVQDAKAILGALPVGDLLTVSLVIDWANALAVYGALSSDVDTLSTQAGFIALREYSEDELRRMALLLRLDIGE